MPETNDLIENLARTYQQLDAHGDIKFPGLMAVTLAQWMLESDRGTSKLATHHNNFAGLKFREEMRGPDATGDDRGEATPVTYTAHDGRDEYCRFRSLENFIFGYWRFIARAPYRGFERYSDNPEGYVRFLEKCGYATDLAYADKVLGLLPEAEGVIDDLAPRMPLDAVASTVSERAASASGRDRRGQDSPDRQDAIYLHSGDAGLVQEWENTELIDGTETGRDVDRLLEFLDTTEVPNYVLLPQRDGATRQRRRSAVTDRADGVYLFDSPEGRVEEWEAGEIVAEEATDGNVDALLGFLDKTQAKYFFIEVPTRRAGRRGRTQVRAEREPHDGASRSPLVPMDEDDSADRVRGSLEGLRVALDVGHGITARGFRDPGAVNNEAGIQEHALNRIVANIAAERLRDRGAVVSVFLYDDASDRRTLIEKGRRAHGQDVFVSCHHNSASNRTAQGTETLLTPRHSTAEDRRLAIAVQNALVASLRLKDRGVKDKELGVLKGAGAGVKAKCLIEPFFVSERSMTLAKAEGMARDAGDALAKGIADYWLHG